MYFKDKPNLIKKLEKKTSNNANSNDKILIYPSFLLPSDGSLFEAFRAKIHFFNSYFYSLLRERRVSFEK